MLHLLAQRRLIAAFVTYAPRARRVRAACAPPRARRHYVRCFVLRTSALTYGPPREPKQRNSPYVPSIAADVAAQSCKGALLSDADVAAAGGVAAVLSWPAANVEFNILGAIPHISRSVLASACVCQWWATDAHNRTTGTRVLAGCATAKTSDTYSH